MKYIAYIAGEIMFLFFGMVIIFTISGRMNRQKDLESGFPQAVEQTIENTMISKKYDISKKEEFLADFVENLSYSLNTDSEVTVQVFGKDTEKGLLSIRVIADYIHPNGKKAQVQCEKTVIVNKIIQEELVNRSVFYLSKEDLEAGRNIYKIYITREEKFPTPRNPVLKSRSFAGWQKGERAMEDTSAMYNEDNAYYALWN